MPSLSRLSVLGLPLGLLLACGSTGTTTVPPDAQTLIAVDPVDFPQLQCGNGEITTGTNAAVSSAGRPFGSYVAELVDVSGVVDYNLAAELPPEFAIQAAPPTSCQTAVAFGKVTKFRHYQIRVDVYGEAPASLCAVAVGTPVIAARDSAGNCGTQPAEPVARLTCYGWRAPVTGDTASGSAGASSAERTDLGGNGQAGSPGIDLASPSAGSTAGEPAKTSVTGGEGGAAFAPNKPGLAIEYQTVTLHACVADR